MPAEIAPKAVSRCCVTVVLRASRSISPDCKAVKRCCELSGTALNLEASPKVAAATALHKSTSSPCHCRSEEHTSELQSLMRNSYAVFCLKKKKKKHIEHHIS